MTILVTTVPAATVSSPNATVVVGVVVVRRSESRCGFRTGSLIVFCARGKTFVASEFEHSVKNSHNTILNVFGAVVAGNVNGRSSEV